MNDMSNTPTAGIAAGQGVEMWTLARTDEEVKAGVSAVTVLAWKRLVVVAYECADGKTVAGNHTGNALSPRWDRDEAVADARERALRRLQMISEREEERRRQRAEGGGSAARPVRFGDGLGDGLARAAGGNTDGSRGARR